MIPKRDKNTDIASEVAQGKNLRRRIVACAEEAAKRFMAGESLNAILAEIAKRESFNRMQIQRLVEEANTVAFNKKYDEVRTVQDRRISFELASLADILPIMGEDAPPEIENPNLVKGKPGNGSMQKAASEQQTYSPHTQMLLDKLAARRKKEKEEALYKEAATLSKEIESDIFKVANCLVHSEKYFKNGNQLFNTVLDKVAFEESIIEGIIKKAEYISDKMIETRRIRPDFVLSLSVEPQEKVASALFGKHSLLNKQANEFVEKPKVQPTTDIQDIQQLFDIAKKIQHSQNQVVKIEKNLHGGAN